MTSRSQSQSTCFLQIIEICEVTSKVVLSEEDRWLWSWEPKKTFTVKSAYLAHFSSNITCDSAKVLWNAWAPLKCKIATWLMLRSRVWTADRLANEVSPIYNAQCVMCNATEETALHLFFWLCYFEHHMEQRLKMVFSNK